MLPLSSSLSRLEREMRRAEDYDTWLILANEHDKRSGKAKWKTQTKTDLYDYKSIQSRLDELRELRANQDDVGLLFALNEGIHGNLGGMGKQTLYEQAKVGTKQLIVDYVDEIVDALHHISNLPVSEQITHQDKMDFFNRAHLCFGRSALMLSGAGSLGHFHHGVVKTLIKHDMLPRVISGSSAGSVFAAVIGTHTDEELELVLNDPEITQTMQGSDVTSDGLIRPQIDAETLKLTLEHIIPDLTFQEAYEKTGRMISVTIAPLEEHQTSRLMNAITSPNVFIRSAVMASCAVPGLFPPVMLTAKNVYGEEQPYLAQRRWVDGSVTDDLPAKRLARLYGVNHYIVSQANPLALAFMSTDKIPMPKMAKSIIQHSTKEWLRASEEFTRKYFRQIPSIGQSMSMFYSLMAQDYAGDVTIVPSFNYVDPQKLMARLSPEEIDDLVEEGERGTWIQLERIRICTAIGRTLDDILDTHAAHNVRAFYKKHSPKVQAAGKQPLKQAQKTAKKQPAKAKAKAKVKAGKTKA